MKHRTGPTVWNTSKKQMIKPKMRSKVRRWLAAQWLQPSVASAQWLQPSVASRPVFTVGGTEPPTFNSNFFPALVPPTVAKFLSGTVLSGMFLRRKHTVQ